MIKSVKDQRFIDSYAAFHEQQLINMRHEMELIIKQEESEKRKTIEKLNDEIKTLSMEFKSLKEKIKLEIYDIEEKAKDDAADFIEKARLEMVAVNSKSAKLDNLIKENENEKERYKNLFESNQAMKQALILKEEELDKKLAKLKEIAG